MKRVLRGLVAVVFCAIFLSSAMTSASAEIESGSGQKVFDASVYGKDSEGWTKVTIILDSDAECAPIPSGYVTYIIRGTWAVGRKAYIHDIFIENRTPGYGFYQHFSRMYDKDFRLELPTRSLKNYQSTRLRIDRHLGGENMQWAQGILVGNAACGAEGSNDWFIKPRG